MNRRRRLGGFHAVQAALEHAPEQVTGIWVNRLRRDKRLANVAARLKELGIVLDSVDTKDLDKLCDSRNHQGIVIELDLPGELTERELGQAIAKHSKTTLLLVLDCVQDPHNLGACLRTADAVGAHGIVITKDKSVGITPTVYKIASGAAESVPVYRVTNMSRALKWLKKKGIWIIGAAGEASLDLYATDMTGPVAIVIGAEATGLRRLTREQCDLLVRLPMQGQIQSLNLSVAAGVLLYEVVRQRGSR